MLQVNDHHDSRFNHSRNESSSTQALNVLDDCRIKNVRPLIPPQILMEDYPLSAQAIKTISKGRAEAESIIKGNDDRLLVVVGPCSIHDTKAGLEYAKLLRAFSDEAKDELHILMRAYFEKPRTTIGWKGLINDPNLDGSFQINKGLRTARSFLIQCSELGVPVAVEFLDQISPQYIADTVSWGAIGARTTESQCHRELASGLSTPVGFKNGTNGSVGIAIDAIRAAQAGHVFLSVTKQGLSAIVETHGNDSCHVILRGSNSGPNYSSEHVRACVKELQKAQLRPTVMVDCSHGNSEKQHLKQLVVVEDIAKQLEAEVTKDYIMGVMIESNLIEGKQSLEALGPANLAYGQSITDACLSWEMTKSGLNRLREAVKARRSQRSSNA
ncbi:hypothetical protein O181_035711 [Austropuccinia psidii MF-1]|uniref:Phospho-2-dehydro-3-deoxyheptonate aldolase n=1 Tax=Austropuccinia psidii MF-1 TaxID=1389203 RepID=A0A9Q3D8S9_9BASI|nr:hypothetical protein [Austropuccinia psidii MF-1]